MSKKLTTQEFIERAKSVHGEKYDYSSVEYVDSHTKINIICKEHGSFFQKPYKHLQGHCCPSCNTIRYTLDDVKKILSDKWKDYDFSNLTYYENNRTEFKVICNIHGEFISNFDRLHIRGCPKCGRSNRNDKISVEEFINKSNLIHNYKYNYDEVDFKSVYDKVNIICEEHGVFIQTAYYHMLGNRCPKCSIEINKLKIRNEKSKIFIEKSKKIHNDKYNYSKSNYINATTKVCIICSIHGEFWQTPNMHLRGNGCPKCSNKNLTTKDIIYKSKLIHGNLYNYDKTKYINSYTDICITCKKHGDFWQKPSVHLSGCGCPKCNSSHGENKIRTYLINNNIDFIEEKTFDECVYKHKLRFDFYIPSKNLCIEYDGKQHFSPYDFTSSLSEEELNKKFHELQIRDKIKNDFCKSKNIELLRIPYYKFKSIDKILDEFFS